MQNGLKIIVNELLILKQIETMEHNKWTKQQQRQKQQVKKKYNIFVDRTLIANGKMLRYRCVCAFIEN